MINAPQSLEVLCCSAALAAQTSMLYFLYCNLILLLIINLRKNMGGEGNQPPPSLWWSFTCLKTAAYISFRFFSSGLRSPSSFNFFFYGLYFLGYLCCFRSFWLPPPLLKYDILHSIPVKWNNCISWITLKTSHLSILTWWFFFSSV